ncbi:uncharacterized protein [Dermacentor albipictus]|uniref:uncharacterized protein isoform X2 n=1 Tax=Dermacentor albipictus TaxID=60249 RepID=UPI0031FBC2A4
MSIDVEPGTSTMSSTRSEDWSSSWTSDTQSRTNTTTGTMTSSASAVPSGLPSGITPSGTTPPGITPSGITPSAIPPRAPQNVRFSGTALKSQPRPLMDTADTSDLKALSEPRGREGALLSFLGCIQVLLVILSRMLSAPYAETPRSTDASEHTQKPNPPPGFPRPAVGHVGALCNDSAPWLGEADGVEGVCRCLGTGLSVVEGVCFYSTTPTTKTTRSPTSSTSSRRPSTKSLPSSMRFSVVRTVRLRTTTASSETEAESVTTEGGVGPNSSETGGRAHDEEDPRGPMAPNVTAQWEEEEEAVENREARAKKTYARDPSVRQLNVRAFMSAETL